MQDHDEIEKAIKQATEQFGTGDFYTIFEVGKQADIQGIKKAYKNAALKYHPDKEGGSTAKFQAIASINGILSSKDKKFMYDTFYHNNEKQQKTAQQSQAYADIPGEHKFTCRISGVSVPPNIRNAGDKDNKIKFSVLIRETISNIRRGDDRILPVFSYTKLEMMGQLFNYVQSLESNDLSQEKQAALLEIFYAVCRIHRGVSFFSSPQSANEFNEYVKWLKLDNLSFNKRTLTNSEKKLLVEGKVQSLIDDLCKQSQPSATHDNTK